MPTGYQKSKAAPSGGPSPNSLIEVYDFTPIEPRIDVADAAALGAFQVSADGLPWPIRQAVKLQDRHSAGMLLPQWPDLNLAVA
jgi:hypothetical protein